MSNASVTNSERRYFRIFGVMAFCLLPLALAWNLLRALCTLVLANDSFSQILVVPLVTVFFIYENRRRIFSAVSFSWLLGIAFIVPGFASVFAARLDLWHLRPTNQEVLLVFGIVIICLGAFGLMFGADAFGRARFPLLFLLFSVPIPEPLLSGIIHFLQNQSADAAEMFFRLAGLPYLRQDLIFRLPGVSIRVAEECSGIRSSLALLITTALASYLFLRARWKRLLLCVVVVPLAVLKNGLRIATLSTLAIYVDPGFLYGNLHRRGGIVFFMLALIPVALLIKILERGESAFRGDEERTGLTNSYEI
jgi:exosortase